VKPRKMDQYLAEGERLVALVNDYRAAKGAASAEGAPLLQSGSPDPDCNKPKFTDLRKSYRLPPQETPTPIEGFPLNPSPAPEVPDFGTVNRVKRLRRAGRTLPDPIGPPSLLKAREASIDPSRIERHDVRTRKVAE
jgi:hypothetical protein